VIWFIVSSPEIGMHTGSNVHAHFQSLEVSISTYARIELGAMTLR
jgi:hypothetical protein